MVHNPIYDGPVYESVQTHFDSLTTQVTVATSTPLENSCTKYPQSGSRENGAEKNRYISQPGITDNGTVESITNQHNGEHFTGTLSVLEDNVVVQKSKSSIA